MQTYKNTITQIKNITIKPSSLVAILLALIIIIPIIIILLSLFTPYGDNWQHLFDYLLATYISNSIMLAIGVIFFSALFGISTAFITTNYNFTGKKTINWGLVLPLAIPAYILAYTWTSVFDTASSLQINFYQIFGFYLPDIRNLFGAILMLSLALYPYVYLLTKNAFLRQSNTAIAISKLADYNKIQIFFKVYLALARPSIIAGLTLVVMESLADYGTVSYFSVQVFTTGIFKSWFSLADIHLAAKLSVILLIFIFVILYLEKSSRQRAKYYNLSNKDNKVQVVQLTGFKNILALLICLVPIVLGFLIPAIILGHWALLSLGDINNNFIHTAINSFYIAFISAILITLIALFFAFIKRNYNNKLFSPLLNIVNLGYAMPGAVVAIGIMIAFSYLNNNLGITLYSTTAGIIFAYIIRFSVLANNSIDSALQKLKISIDNSGRTLGYKPLKLWSKVHLPLISNSILTAFLLVFIEVLKELPATLILRPFNFDTLAIKAFELASDERLADSAIYALSLVIIGLIPVILVNKQLNNNGTTKH